jgi:pantoate--beta-alanine ligase
MSTIAMHKNGNCPRYPNENERRIERQFMAAPDESRIEIVQDVESLRLRLAAWRRTGETIGLVPTMGALHAGHISLVREAKRRATRTVMSIFVNPTQFAPGEDFGAYPRSLEADVARFAAAGGDLVFAPETLQIYPPGFATRLSMGGPAAAGLEDRFRPAHFAGVVTIVAKFLNQCRPDTAIFGEKDYQQLKVVERMVRDLDFETKIIGVATVREADGLALSSRNIFLPVAERAIAPSLYAALRRCAREINEGIMIETALDTARATIAAAGFAMDYFEARHAESLAPVTSRIDGPVRLLAAAKLGKTRLIDNIGL